MSYPAKMRTFGPMSGHRSFYSDPAKIWMASVFESGVLMTGKREEESIFETSHDKSLAQRGLTINLAYEESSQITQLKESLLHVHTESFQTSNEDSVLCLRDWASN